MFGRIVRKELMEIMGSTKFTTTFGVCSLLIILSFFLGGRGFLVGQAQFEAAVAEDRRQLEGETDWLSVTPSVFLPPQPLAYLVSGVAHDIGRSAEVTGLGSSRPEGSRYGQEPLLALFRFVDLEFTFQVVLSLLAVLFAYDSICGERERGTLRLVFANAVPRSTFLLAKIAGAAVALIVPLLIPIGIGCLLLIFLGVPMAADDWVRLALVIVAGFLYIGAVLGLSVLVSSLTRSSSTAFVTLLTLWVVAVLVVPRSSVLLAARAVDVPSVDEALSERSRLRSQLWNEDRKKIREFMREGMAQAEQSDDPQAAMQSRIGRFNTWFDELSAEREEKVAVLDARLAEERANRQRWQQRLAFGLARVSPASAFSLAAASLAGTSLELPQHYLDRIHAYQERFAAFQRKKTGRRGGSMRIVIKTGDDDEEEPGPIDAAELPAFAYEPPPLDRALRAAVGDLSLLVMYVLLFFTGSFVAFLRYDVR